MVIKFIFHVDKRDNTVWNDARLSCPACFSTLCLSAQRHERYLTQYRAFEIFNCRILEMGTGPLGWEECASVLCSSCDTPVGAFDTNGWTHFYQVLPSTV